MHTIHMQNKGILPSKNWAKLILCLSLWVSKGHISHTGHWNSAVFSSSFPDRYREWEVAEWLPAPCVPVYQAGPCAGLPQVPTHSVAFSLLLFICRLHRVPSVCAVSYSMPPSMHVAHWFRSQCRIHLLPVLSPLQQSAVLCGHILCKVIFFFPLCDRGLGPQ